MKKHIDYSVYLVTDSSLMTTETVEECVERAIIGGATIVQIREKDLQSLDFYNEALRVKEICQKYGVPLIVNDRIDIALAVGADGVHIGQEDIPAKIVRSIIGEDMILGVSARTVQEAEQAQADGADYLGIGAMFSTDTKTNAKLVSKDELRAIKKAVDIPVVIIGGINERTIPLFDDCEIDGVAVVSAIIAKQDITQAASDIRKLYYSSRRPIITGKKLAIFDLDGTLLNSLDVWFKIDGDLFAKRGQKMPDDFFEKTMAMSFYEASVYAINEYGFDDTPQQIMQELHDMSIREYSNNIKLKPHSLEYLHELKDNGVRLIVATSFGSDLYLPVLKNNGILDIFEGVYSVDEVGVGKNSGKIYQYALDKCGVSAYDAILFEDIPQAAASGKSLGLTIVGVKDVYNLCCQEELKNQADFYIADYISAPKL